MVIETMKNDAHCSEEVGEEEDQILDKAYRKIVRNGNVLDPSKNQHMRIEEELARTAIKERYRIPCPVWTCGGFMRRMEKRPTKEEERSGEDYDGDWKTPDLVCSNCKTRYRVISKKKKASPSPQHKDIGGIK